MVNCMEYVFNNLLPALKSIENLANCRQHWQHSNLSTASKLKKEVYILQSNSSFDSFDNISICWQLSTFVESRYKLLPPLTNCWQLSWQLCQLSSPEAEASKFEAKFSLVWFGNYTSLSVTLWKAHGYWRPAKSKKILIIFLKPNFQKLQDNFKI